eukprot:5023262-Amphidinium_carterae.1
MNAPESAKNSSGYKNRSKKFECCKVNTQMLHVDDPVNCGVPSVLEVEIEWLPVVRDGLDMGSFAATAEQQSGRWS